MHRLHISLTPVIYGHALKQKGSSGQIGKWLEDNKLEHLKAPMAKADIDGAALMGLYDTWKKDPAGRQLLPPPFFLPFNHPPPCVLG